MMGSFLSRALLMVFGYAYPAYECFKAVESNKPAQIEQLLFWCQYWILVAMFTVFERLGDAFISWLPMYSEAKLAFLIYLWYPKTKGTGYVYNFLLRPYVAKHETEIDRNLLKLSVKAREIGLLFWQEAASYGQTKFLDILQYISSQSASQPRCTVQLKQPQPDSSSATLSQQKHELAEEAGDLPTSLPCSDESGQSATEATSLETMPVEQESSLGNENLNFSKAEQKTVSKEAAAPQSRGKWRIFRTVSN